MIMRSEGGICYTHGPYTTGVQCPFFPQCNSPKDEFIRMGNARVYTQNKVYSQAELDKAVDNFRTAVLTLLDEKAAEWASDAERQTSYQPAIDYTKRDAARELKGLVEKLETKQ